MKSKWYRGIRARLLVMTLFPCFILILVSIFSVRSMKYQSDFSSSVAKEKLPQTRTIEHMRATVYASARFMNAAILAKDAKARQEGIDSAKKYQNDFLDLGEAFIEMGLNNDLKEKFSTISAANREFVKDENTVFEMIKTIDPVSDEKAVQFMFSEITPKAKKVTDLLDEGAQILNTTSETAIAGVEKITVNTQNWLYLICAASLISLLVIGLWIAHKLSSSLVAVSQQIRDAGEQVDEASAQLSRAANQVSSGSTHAASSLEETVASVEELSAMVSVNADNARQAASLSKVSTQAAETGEQEVHNLILAMTEISQGSKKVEEIINVIDDIAFQTNLLALNAAVEAARAGDQGKGFAVVAEAVRNLAQRSADAAKEITTLIKESVEKTVHGVKIADATGTSLKNILVSVKKVTDINNEIASASAEQANGIQQISKAMNELDTTTQQNASASEEVAASAEEMSSQSAMLKEQVRDLGQIIQGGKENSSSPVVSDFLKKPVESETTARTTRKSAKLECNAENIIPFNDRKSESKGKIGNTKGF